jgi:hypothetical protein
MMFRMPTRGFSESINKHNCDLEPFADWVEGSVLFLGEPVTRSDLVDRLVENSIYRDQSFAHQWVDTVFGELRRRFCLLSGATPVAVEGTRIVSTRPWKDRPAYAFCVALAIQVHYRKEVLGAIGRDCHIQGRLFEQLIAELLRANDWKVEPTGWSHQTARSVEQQVRSLAAAIGEGQRGGAVERWTAPQAKDSGLDLVAWQAFPDGWSGRPICLLQCASGENWTEKLATPNLQTWEKLIEFTTAPRRGLAMPFAPEADEFRRRANQDGLMLLLDRHRLMHTKAGTTYPSADLAKELIQWTETRVNCFPRN